MRQPPARVAAYHEVLRRTLACAPQDHCAAAHLASAQHDWAHLLEATERARQQQNNEEKLASIELSFPRDTLHLFQSDATDLGAVGDIRGDRTRKWSPAVPLTLLKRVSQVRYGDRRRSERDTLVL